MQIRHLFNLEEILTFQDETQPEQFLLTVYHPSHTVNSKDTDSGIKSLVMDTIRQEALLLHSEQLPLKLATYLVGILEEHNEERAPGFAIFVRFDPKAINRAHPDEVAKYIQYHLITLSKRVEPSAYLGETFDVAPLLFQDLTTIQALIVTIDAKQGGIYQLTNDTLEVIDQLQNPFLNFPEEPHLNHGPTGQGGGNFHGTGNLTFDRRFELAYQKFAEQVLRRFCEISTNGFPWKQLLVFASKEQQPHLEKTLEKVLLPRIQTPPLIGHKFPSTSQEIKNFSQDIVNAAQDRQLLGIAEDVVENWGTYAIGWEDVTAAARENRIERLLIAPDAQHFGYIVEKTLPFTTPVEHAQRVKNLAPWLTQAVLRAGGEVYSNEYIPQLAEAMVAAKLRW